MGQAFGQAVLRTSLASLLVSSGYLSGQPVLLHDASCSCFPAPSLGPQCCLSCCLSLVPACPLLTACWLPETLSPLIASMQARFSFALPPDLASPEEGNLLVALTTKLVDVRLHVTQLIA